MIRRILSTISLCLCIFVGLLIISPATSFATTLPPAFTAASATRSLTVSELSQRATSSWPWYVSRAAGLVAAVLLVLLVLSGIGQLTGFTYRFMEPLMSWSLHRALAIAFGVTVCIHGLSLLLDKYVPFTLLRILVPFASHYQPAIIFGIHLGSLYVAYGILASYIAAILIASSLFWVDTKHRPWRLLHYLSYVLAALVFLHALYMGSDLSHGFLRVLWWFIGIILVIGVVSRLRRAGTIRQAKQKS